MDMKYKLLTELIASQHERWGDEIFIWHEVIIDVVEILSSSHGGEEELADALFNRIATHVVQEDE